MSAPRLLDLFCGAGGAAKGYQLAGFHVTGVAPATATLFRELERP